MAYGITPELLNSMGSLGNQLGVPGAFFTAPLNKYQTGTSEGMMNVFGFDEAGKDKTRNMQASWWDAITPDEKSGFVSNFLMPMLSMATGGLPSALGLMGGKWGGDLGSTMSLAGSLMGMMEPKTSTAAASSGTNLTGGDNMGFDLNDLAGLLGGGGQQGGGGFDISSLLQAFGGGGGGGQQGASQYAPLLNMLGIGGGGGGGSSWAPYYDENGNEVEYPGGPPINQPFPGGGGGGGIQQILQLLGLGGGGGGGQQGGGGGIGGTIGDIFRGNFEDFGLGGVGGTSGTLNDIFQGNFEDFGMGGGGGQGGTLQDILGGNWEDILGILNNGKMDDMLRDYGIPIGMSYLASREAEPWEKMVENSINSMYGIGQGQMGQYNDIMGGGWDWSDPTQLMGQTAIPTSGGYTGGGTPAGGKIDLTADLNQDGKVSMSDLNILKNSFNTKSGDDKYNPAADINKDGKVTTSDLNLLKSQFNRDAGDYTQASGEGGYQPPKTAVNPMNQYGPTEEGISPYEQYIRQQAYGTMNPLGDAESGARLGQMYDSMSGNFDERRNQAIQLAAARGQSTDPAQNPALAQELENITNDQTLGMQGAQRDMFTYGEGKKQQYGQNLMQGLSPMFNVPQQAAATMSLAGSQANQAAQNIYNNYGDLAQAFAMAGQGDDNAMDAVLAYLTAMQGAVYGQGAAAPAGASAGGAAGAQTPGQGGGAGGAPGGTAPQGAPETQEQTFWNFIMDALGMGGQPPTGSQTWNKDYPQNALPGAGGGAAGGIETNQYGEIKPQTVYPADYADRMEQNPYIPPPREGGPVYAADYQPGYGTSLNTIPPYMQPKDMSYLNQIKGAEQAEMDQWLAQAYQAGGGGVNPAQGGGYSPQPSTGGAPQGYSPQWQNYFNQWGGQGWQQTPTNPNYPTTGINNSPIAANAGYGGYQMGY